jgi:hypothetical protein
MAAEVLLAVAAARITAVAAASMLVAEAASIVVAEVAPMVAEEEGAADLMEFCGSPIIHPGPKSCLSAR